MGVADSPDTGGAVMSRQNVRSTRAELREVYAQIDACSVCRGKSYVMRFSWPWSKFKTAHSCPRCGFLSKRAADLERRITVEESA